MLLALLAALPFCCSAPCSPAPAQDAREAFLASFDAWIGRHRSLKSIQRTRLESWPPIVVDVQIPADAPPDYAAAVAGELGPWVQRLEAIFQRELVEPLGLARDPEHPVLPLVILATRGDFVNFLEGAPGARRSEMVAFDPTHGAVVTFRDTRRPFRGYRESVLWSCAMALIESHRLEPGQPMEAPWLEIALPVYLSHGGALLPDDLERHPPEADAVAWAARYARDPGLRAAYLHDVRTLLSFERDHAAVAATQRKCAEQELRFEVADARMLLYAQSYLLLHYLNHGNGGQERATFLRYVERVLAGESGPQAAAATFDDTRLDALDAALWRYVEELSKTVGTNVLVRTPGVYAPKPEAEPTDVATADAGAAVEVDLVPTAPAPPPEVWSVEDLALRPDELGPWIARAVHRAVGGDLELALVELDAADAFASEPEHARRLTTERERLRAMQELRERVLDELLGAKKSLKLDVGERKLLAKIAAVEDDCVRLEDNRLGIETVEKTALAPAFVLDHASKEAIARAGRWIAAWPDGVAGGTSWRRTLLRDDSEQAASLRADAEAYYPTIAGAARAAFELERIAQLAVATEVADANELYEAVLGLWRDHASEEFVRVRAAALRGCARRALELLAEGYDVTTHLHAKSVERLDDGRMRLAYSFDEPAELSDFRVEADYHALRQMRMPALALPEAETALAVEGGRLAGNGSRTLVHALDFEAPMTVSWRASYSYVEGKPMAGVYFWVGICGDPKGHHVRQDITGWLYQQTADAFVQLPGLHGHGFEADRVYVMEMRHDGTTTESWMDGELQGGVPAGTLTSGNVFVCIHSDMLVFVHDVTIEGRPTPASIERARARWVRERVDAIGIELESDR